MFLRWFGPAPAVMEELKESIQTFSGRVAGSVSRLARPSRLPLPGPASLVSPLTHTGPDTVRGQGGHSAALWVQFVCFNGQEAPELTADGPLWAAHS